MFHAIVLLNSPLPSAKDLEVIKNVKSENGLVSLDDWLKTQLWFDVCERSEDRETALPFARVDLVKAVLFRLNSD